MPPGRLVGSRVHGLVGITGVELAVAATTTTIYNKIIMIVYQPCKLPIQKCTMSLMDCHQVRSVTLLADSAPIKVQCVHYTLAVVMLQEGI